MNTPEEPSFEDVSTVELTVWMYFEGSFLERNRSRGRYPPELEHEFS